MILRQFRDHIPVEEPPEFRELFHYLFEGSLGCVGLLKSWIVRALWLALEDGGKQLTRKHLDQTRMSDYELAKMAEEISKSENTHRESERDRRTIRACIDRQPEIIELPKNGKSRNKKRVKKSFKRNPCRDEISNGYQPE